MSLDITIFKKSKNHYAEHPYLYDDEISETDIWSENITHNMGKMASHIPVTRLENNGGLYEYNLYQVCWRPEEQGWNITDDILPMLIEGIKYMLDNRKELLQYNPSNGWGTYEVFMKFLLDYKQACEDNPGCKIEADR